MTFDVHIQFSTWRAVAWVRLMRVAAPLIGEALATKWAWSGSHRLVRWRLVGERRWKALP